MKFAKLISIFAFALASAGFAFAAPGKIQVSAVADGVVFSSADGSQKQYLAGDVFSGATTIATPANASARVVLGNGTVIALEPGTKIEIVQFEQNNPAAVDGQKFASFSSEPEATSGSMTTVRLYKGTASFKVAKLLASSKLTVKTRAGDIVVKGTTFSVSDDANGVTTSVVEGQVAVMPTNRATVSVAGGRAVTLPVSGTGVVAAPVYKLTTPEVEKRINDNVVVEGARPAATAPAGTTAEAPVGADPEVPAWAQGTDVSGPDSGYLDSASSVGR